MPRVTVFGGTAPIGVACGTETTPVLVTNRSGATAFYRASPTVSSTQNDGSLAAGSSVALAGQQWFFVAAVGARAEIDAQPLPRATASPNITAGNRVFFIGDSITKFCESDSNADGTGSTSFAPLHQARSWIAAASMLSDGRMVFAGLSATGGFTTAQIMASHLPVALASDGQIVVVLGGRNDVVNGVASSTTIANLRTMYTQILGSGRLPACCTLSAANANSTAQKQATNQINTFVRTFAGRFGCPLVDFAAATTDATTGGWTSGLNADNSHPLPPGARVMGTTLNAALTPFLPPYKPPYAYFQDAPANGGNSFANPLFLTDTNADGTPDNWTKAGTATSTISLVAASSGDALGQWMRIARTGGAGAAQAYSDPVAVNVGDRLALGFRFRNANIEAANAQIGIRLVTTAASADAPNNSGLVLQYVAGINSWVGDQATPGLWYQEATVTAGSFASLVVSLPLGTTTTIDVSQVSLFNLTQMGAL